MFAENVMTDADIAQFNAVREHLKGKEFPKKEMMNVLKEKLGLKAWDATLTAFAKGVNPPIIRVKRGIYTFNPKPVFKDRLELVFNELHNTNRQYQKNRDCKNLEVMIAEAIKLLKNNGYKVYKSIIRYEEVLLYLRLEDKKHPNCIRNIHPSVFLTLCLCNRTSTECKKEWQNIC